MVTIVMTVGGCAGYLECPVRIAELQIRLAPPVLVQVALGQHVVAPSMRRHGM